MIFPENRKNCEYGLNVPRNWERFCDVPKNLKKLGTFQPWRAHSLQRGRIAGGQSVKRWYNLYMDNDRFEIVPEEDGLLREYEKLFQKKQRILQECTQLRIRFMKLFGSLQVERFELQVQTIRQRKEIALYVQAYNRGEAPDSEVIEAVLDETMESYRSELDQLIAQNAAVGKAVPVTEEKKLKVRRIYRELVHLMHPDLHPDLENNETVKDLWNQLNTAYQVMDLETMEEIRVEVVAVLSGLPDAGVLPSVDRLKERIQKLKTDIDAIQSRDPYRYKEWIYDGELVSEKSDELKEQINELKDYSTQLTDNLARLISAREKTHA